MILDVSTPDGSSHALEALEGWRVMEAIRDGGLPIIAECGGACSRATRHVYVDEAFDVRDSSRLSCQILMRDDLDGLHVTIAAGPK
ncbi:MAG: 2Fe-2S iron-sulfur cluster-binding protein [Thalassobaculaceae bacterium]|nr:2Fe-2S iron-sulfur cluster-binding protein [Thalassobaculaceae bacterium]